MKQTEVLTVGADRPRTRPGRARITVAVALTGALLAAAFLAVNRHDQPRAATAKPGSAPSSLTEPSASADPSSGHTKSLAGHPPGLLINGVDDDSVLDRRDSTATSGPWAVVVRGPGGSLGHNSAVVTFPMSTAEPGSTSSSGPAIPSGQGGGRTVRVGSVLGRITDGELTWPIGGAQAWVRGDVPARRLLEIAGATRVVNGRPLVAPAPGRLVTTVAPARPVYLPEAHYGSADAGESATLGNGLTYTGVVGSGGFEDALYQWGFQPSGTVHGKPAVITSVQGGNGVLAWEPLPGVVAYVGYSGELLEDGAIAALHRLAERASLVSPSRWRSLQPDLIDGVNTIQ
jgi:hypothetical protein